MESEHGQTLVGVLRRIYAPKLWELARQAAPGRAEHCRNPAWTGTLRNGLTTWVERLSNHRQKSADLSRDAGPQASTSCSQVLETALEKGTTVAHRRTTQSISSAHPMDSRTSLTPQQNIQALTEEWGARRNSDTAAPDTLLCEWTAKSVPQLLSSMKGNLARGVDGWTLGETLRLPKSTLEGLASVTQAVEASLAPASTYWHCRANRMHQAREPPRSLDACTRSSLANHGRIWAAFPL